MINIMKTKLNSGQVIYSLGIDVYIFGICYKNYKDYSKLLQDNGAIVYNLGLGPHHGFSSRKMAKLAIEKLEPWIIMEKLTGE